MQCLAVIVRDWPLPAFVQGSMGAFTIPIVVRLIRITLLIGFKGGSNLGAAVFS
jgi:hypothetical protein